MDIPWDDAQLFLAIAESGSVSSAARALKITQPTASRRLAQLEARLGEPLVTRSVAGVTLTPFGERICEPARRMAEWAGELGRAAERAESEVEGVVRITAPPGFAYELCAPFAAFVRERLPEVRLEISSTVRYVDVARRETDLALRLAKPTGRELTLLCSRSIDAVPFAAREYAARLGRRPKARDIDWVGWTPAFDGVPPSSILSRLVPGFRPSFASDDYLVQIRAAELGLGAIFSGRFRHRFARETSLVELDVEGIPAMKTALHLVCARGALDVPRVRAVADLLVDVLEGAETQKGRARASKR